VAPQDGRGDHDGVILVGSVECASVKLALLPAVGISCRRRMEATAKGSEHVHSQVADDGDLSTAITVKSKELI